MNSRIEAQPPGQAPARGDAGQAPALLSGRLGGTPVQVLDTVSVLGDAAEEISLHLSAHVESKTHSERRIRASTRPPLVSLDQIRHYLEKVDHLGSLKDVTQALRQPGGVEDALAAALARAGSTPDDPAEHYLLLQYVLQIGLSEGVAPQVLAHLDEALSELHDESGGIIQARLATIDDASGYAHNVQQVRQFQVAVDTLLDQPTLSLALQEVLQLSGRTGAQLDSAVEGLIKALGTCLSLSGVDCQKPLLQTLLTDLYHLKSLNTILRDCKVLLRRLRPDLNAIRPHREPQDAESSQ